MSAGCAFSVRVSASAGPSKMMLLSLLPIATSTSSNTSPRGGEIRRQRFPHPDGLAALAREHKSDGHVLSVNDCTEIAPKDTSIPVLSSFAASGNVATTLFPLDSTWIFQRPRR